MSTTSQSGSGETRKPQTCRVCGSWAEFDLCVSCAIIRAESPHDSSCPAVWNDSTTCTCGVGIEWLDEDGDWLDLPDQSDEEEASDG